MPVQKTEKSTGKRQSYRRAPHGVDRSSGKLKEKGRKRTVMVAEKN
jgi:hypothetical protein